MISYLMTISLRVFAVQGMAHPTYSANIYEVCATFHGMKLPDFTELQSSGGLRQFPSLFMAG